MRTLIFYDTMEALRDLRDAIHAAEKVGLHVHFKVYNKSDARGKWVANVDIKRFFRQKVITVFEYFL